MTAGRRALATPVIRHPDPDRLEERDVDAQVVDLTADGAQRERPLQPGRGVPEPRGQRELASVLGRVRRQGRVTQMVDRPEHGVLVGGLRSARQHRPPVVAGENPEDDVVQVTDLPQHLVDVPAERLLRLVGGGVLGERLAQPVGDRRVADEQPVELVQVGAVDPGDRLHQRGAAHRLVQVHGVQRRRVEPGEQHRLDDDQFERVARILRAALDDLVLRRPADVFEDLTLIAAVAGVNDLDLSGFEGVVVPAGAQRGDLLVEVGADLPGGTDDHPFAWTVDELPHRRPRPPG